MKLNLWMSIDTAWSDQTIVVASGLLSTSAKWDGKGWWSKSLKRYVKATHWHPFSEAHRVETFNTTDDDQYDMGNGK